jgi:hypothetical protein
LYERTAGGIDTSPTTLERVADGARAAFEGQCVVRAIHPTEYDGVLLEDREQLVLIGFCLVQREGQHLAVQRLGVPVTSLSQIQPRQRSPDDKHVRVTWTDLPVEDAEGSLK